MNDCGKKGREVIVTLRPHLPIRVNPVYVAIASPRTDNKLIDEICVVGDADGFHECGMVFQPGHGVGQPMRFKFMTNCATNSATVDATYQLQHSHHILDPNQINRFWANYNFPKIEVGSWCIIMRVQKPPNGAVPKGKFQLKCVVFY